MLTSQLPKGISEKVSDVEAVRWVENLYGWLLVGNEGEVVTDLAHLKSVDIDWVWKVFQPVDKFVVTADNETIPLPGLPPLRLSFRPDI